MRGTTTKRTSVLLALLVAVGCERGLGSDTVARAGDFRLEVEPVAQLLAPAEGIPVDSSVVQAVADFWIDYTLLAWMLNAEGEMEAVDLSTLIEQQRSRMLVGRLRDQVIQVDTAITEEELQEIYELERPADQVRARHILLSYPENATPAQQDSVRTLANQLLERARGGESFATLAEEFSQDPGSAVNGGDLGFYGRGMMVPAFDSASFALEIGDVSDIVETEYGLHIIRVEERVSPEFEEIAFNYRQQVQTQWVTDAETVFLDQLVTAADVQIQDGAAQRVREITANPTVELSGPDAAESLVIYEGGAYTVGDYRDFVLAQPIELRGQVQMALDEHLDGFLRDLVRDRLLIADAERRGIEVRPLELEQIELEIKTQFETFGESLQLGAIEPEASESLEDAVAREVWSLLEGVVAGERELLPLGALSVPLRNHYGAELSPEGVSAATARVAEIRAAEPEVVVPDIVPPGGDSAGAAPPTEGAPGQGTPPAEPTPPSGGAAPPPDGGE
jgi:hypothetical protein